MNLQCCCMPWLYSSFSFHKDVMCWVSSLNAWFPVTLSAVVNIPYDLARFALDINFFYMMLESSCRQDRCLLLNTNVFLNHTISTMLSHVRASMKHMVSTKIWFPCISLQDSFNMQESCCMYRTWSSEHVCVWINAVCSHEWLVSQINDWKYMLIW